jgi:hypothetical protein
MKKKIWIGLSAMLAILMFAIVACTKEPTPDPYYPGGGSGGSGSGGGNSSGSAPSTPTGVSATVDGSRIKVSWNSVSNATSYKVYYSEDGYNYNYTIGTTSNTYIYDNLPYENNYYKVKAINSYGESSLSSSAYCHYSSGGGGGGGGGSSPSAPSGVSASVNGSRIKVSWNSVSNATRYTVYWSSTGANFSSIGSTSSTYLYDDNPYEDNYYKVKAENSYGESSYSSAVYCHYSSGGGGGGSTIHSPCPVHYTSHTATSSTITLRWSNPTSSGCGTPTTAYLRVRVPDGYGEYVTLQTLSGSTTTVSFNYRSYLDSQNCIRMGIVTENSAGSSGGLPLMYNANTNSWSGGNGLELTKDWEIEEIKISDICH